MMGLSELELAELAASLQAARSPEQVRIDQHLCPFIQGLELWFELVRDGVAIPPEALLFVLRCVVDGIRSPNDAYLRLLREGARSV
jgi:hypothetical protein